jgi:hypothetical protein
VVSDLRMLVSVPFIWFGLKLMAVGYWIAGVDPHR